MSLSTNDNFKTNHTRFVLSCSAGSEMAIKEAVFITLLITLLVATGGKKPDESAGKYLCNENLLVQKKKKQEIVFELNSYY